MNAAIQDRQTLIRDEIMWIITDASGNADDQRIHFGIPSLGTQLDGRATIEEIAQAIQWLLDNKYLKRMGAHTIGLGSGKKLKKYPLHLYTPAALTRPMHDQGKADHKAGVTKDEQRFRANFTKRGYGGSKSIPLPDESRPANADGTTKTTVIPAKKDPVIASAARQSTEQPETNMPTAAEAPQTTGEAFPVINQTPELNAAIDKLASQLAGKPVSNLPLKLQTLDKLARLLDPTISAVLNQIKTDLQEVAA